MEVAGYVSFSTFLRKSPDYLRLTERALAPSRYFEDKGKVLNLVMLLFGKLVFIVTQIPSGSSGSNVISPNVQNSFGWHKCGLM